MFKKSLISIAIIVLLLVAAVLTAAGQQEDIADATFVSQDDVRLTIYNSDLTLVQDVRTFELSEGLNRVSFDGVPTSFASTSLTFASTTEGADVNVVQQRFRNVDGALTINELIADNVGEIITITSSRDDATYTGELLVVDGSSMILQTEDSQIVTISTSEIRTFDLPVVNPQERTELPTLDLIVDSDAAGEFQLAISYITSSLNWNVDYNLQLADEDDSVALTGWVNVFNNSGVSYDNAQVVLAGGDFNRLEFVSRESDFSSVVATATAMPTPSPSGFGDTGGGSGGPALEPIAFLFDLPQRISVDVGSNLIEFLPDVATDARNVYVYDASPRIFGFSGYNTNPGYGQTEVRNVRNFLEFSTDADGGLGTDLPGGGIRVFEQDAMGGSVLLGQTRLFYTPENETVQIFLQETDEVTGERRQIGFRELSPDAIEETYEIRVRNLTDEEIEVMVPERMTRSPLWELIGSSVPSEQPDNFSVEFMVTVPAGEEVSFNYTVQYFRPPN